jgi:putative transposase
MTGNQCKGGRINLQEIFGANKDGLKELLRAVLQEVLEQEMTDALGAEKGERSPGRLGYGSGYYSRGLVTRVGKLELRMPQDRQGQFSTPIFARYQRSEKALVSALAELYLQGVSTRQVKAITEELCGQAFSASAISAVNQTLDESLERFAKRPLEEVYPYLVLDARYEKVRPGGVIRSQACRAPSGSTMRADGRSWRSSWPTGKAR